MKASFQQFTESEGLAFGRIYVRRPGRLRVEYDPPSEILLIADGTLLSYYDAELNHIEQVPLKLSPMWFLLREDVKLKTQIPIHTTYITAWANRQGTVSFRDDVYQFDAQGITNFSDA